MAADAEALCFEHAVYRIFISQRRPVLGFRIEVEVNLCNILVRTPLTP